MSNAVKQSLQDNMNDALESLPPEFHEDFKASIESAEPTPRLSDEEAKKQAAELMKEDPNIKDKECIPLLDQDYDLNQPILQPTEIELEAQKEQLLTEVKASLADPE